MTQAASYDPARPAAAAFASKMDGVLPAIRLAGPGGVWSPQRDVLSSGAFARDFVVEMENTGRARLRFGDDEDGMAPGEGTKLQATYRFGNGLQGNIGADVLVHLVADHVLVPAGGDAELANPNGPDPRGQWKPGPLRELVEVIAAQVAVLEEEIEQLYDNSFVETAAPWALPYLGELLGIRGLPSGAMARSPRAEVGHTIAYRRRKGTAPVLEQLAFDITGWQARAVEFFERLAATQHLNPVRRECGSFASLRSAEKLEFVGTAFEPLMRTVEVRRIEPGRGKWNIPNVGIFLRRLRAYSHTASPLVPVELRAGDPLAGRRFRLHPFGFDAPLFLLPITETDITHVAEPVNVPLPITRRMLAGASVDAHPVDTIYGADRSLWIEEFDTGSYRLVSSNRVIVCDLSDATDAASNPVWNHENKPTGDQVALDPVLGRVIFATAPADAQHPPRGTFHLGFSFDLGGGESGRAGSFEADVPTRSLVPQNPLATLPNFSTLTAALNNLGAAGGAIEITDSGRYVETLPAVTANGIAKEIRAADGKCPAVLRPAAGGSGPWTIGGDADGSVSLNGLWLAGALRVVGDLGAFKLRHCTLFEPGGPLEFAARRLQVTIENCILPPLRVGSDGVRVKLRNCIIDAGAENEFALSDLAGSGPAGSWHLENCTVIGKAALDVLELASNCIFLGESVSVRRR